MGDRRALVVDDDNGIRIALIDLLEDEGFVVEEAVDGEIALGMLAKTAYSLVLLDMCMPNMDGRDVLRGLPPDVLAKTPIVLMSALSLGDEASACGFAFVKKPFSVDVLLKAIADSRARLPSRPTDGRAREIVGGTYPDRPSF